MQQHGGKYFVRRPPLPRPWKWGQKVKIQLFQNTVNLHILRGMEHRAPCKHIIILNTHPQLVGWIKRLKKSKCGHVAYHLK